MKRTLVVTLEVDLVELSKEEREECALHEECHIKKLPGVRDMELRPVADCIAGAIVIGDEVFAGASIYANVSDARPKHAKWKRTSRKRTALPLR